MKRKLLLALLTVCITTACAMGLAACGGEVTGGEDPCTHEWGEWQNNGGPVLNCTDPIEQFRICELCGEYEERTITGEHEFGNWEVTEEADCLNEGLQVRYCDVCGFSEEQVIPTNDEHDWSEWAPADENPPTCTENGTEERECYRCGEVETRSAEAYGHSTYLVAAKEPTCIYDGNIEYYKCSRCGSYYEDEAATKQLSEEDITIPATGHTYSTAWSKDEYAHWHAATCEHTTLKSDYGQHDMVAYDSYEECSVCKYRIDHSGNEYIEVFNSTETADGKIWTIGISTRNPESIWYIDFSQIVFPNDVKIIIGTNAFKDLTNLKIVDFTNLTDSWDVVEIEDNAFLNCSSLKEIVIPAHVTSIGDLAFSGCLSLESVTFEENSRLKTLDYGVFANCTSLKSITLPSGVKELPQNLFDGCSALAEVNLPENLTAINAYSFRNCTSLESIVIPDGVTKIDDYAFYGCTNLKSIVLPDSVTSIGGQAFSGCTSLESVTFGNQSQLETIGNYAFAGCTALSDIVLPDSVTSIGAYAFNDCTALKEIIIPDKITVIAENTFANCTQLGKITLPESLTEIKENAFEGYPAQSEIYYGGSIASWCNITGLYYLMADGSYTQQRMLSLGGAALSENLVIPDDITSISSYAFAYTGITSLTIPDSVTAVGDGAFARCGQIATATVPALALGAMDKTNLVTVTITSGDIAANAFNNCKSLESVTLFEGVTNSAGNAFGNCTSVTTVTAPAYAASFLPKANLKTLTITGSGAIGSQAFEEVASLESVTIENGVESIEGSAFYKCTSLKSITIPDSVTNIGEYAFYGCSSLTSLTVPDGIESIGSYTFYDCSSLTSIVIPDSVTSIGSCAFRYCTSLESITLPFVGEKKDGTGNTYFGYIFGKNSPSYFEYIPESLKTVIITSGNSIEDSAFEGCKSLTSIVIPDSVESIGSYAFSYCSSLKNITIPDGAESIGSYAFSYCSSLKNITIPDGAESIGDYAFYKCSSLTSVTIPDSVTSIGSYAFEGCTSLEKVHISDVAAWVGISFANNYATPLYLAGNLYQDGELIKDLVIPDSVESIGSYAFRGCSSLTSIIIPDSVTSIGISAFGYCDSLRKVTIGNGVTSIGNHAFYDCYSLTNVTVGRGVTSIGDYAFSGCYKLVEVCNLSSLELTKGSTENGYVAYYAIIIYTSEDAQTHIKTTDDGYMFYDDEESVYLIGYAGTQTAITLPETFNGKNYSIYKHVLSDCSWVTSITIPGSLETIGSETFYGWTSLTSVIIEKGVTSIGFSAFRGCSSLVSITIPDSVTNIADSAFYKCTSLKSITIPDSVTSIGSYAFTDCNSLESVYITDIAAWCNISFGSSIGSDCNPLSLAGNLYLNGELVTELVIPEGVTSIGRYAFFGCTSLESVTIADSVTKINIYAFTRCSSLTSINISDMAHWCNISGLVNLDKSIVYIDGQKLCEMTSITIPDSVTRIGSYAFSDCTALTSVVFENTSGWWRSFSSTAASGTEISSAELADASTAAEYLKTTYSDYYWNRG